jgi:hypothetical protein
MRLLFSIVTILCIAFAHGADPKHPIFIFADHAERWGEHALMVLLKFKNLRLEISRVAKHVGGVRVLSNMSAHDVHDLRNLSERKFDDIKNIAHSIGIFENPEELRAALANLKHSLNEFDEFTRCDATECSEDAIEKVANFIVVGDYETPSAWATGGNRESVLIEIDPGTVRTLCKWFKLGADAYIPKLAASTMRSVLPVHATIESLRSFFDLHAATCADKFESKHWGERALMVLEKFKDLRLGIRKVAHHTGGVRVLNNMSAEEIRYLRDLDQLEFEDIAYVAHTHRDFTKTEVLRGTLANLKRSLLEFDEFIRGGMPASSTDGVEQVAGFLSGGAFRRPEKWDTFEKRVDHFFQLDPKTIRTVCQWCKWGADAFVRKAAYFVVRLTVLSDTDSIENVRSFFDLHASTCVGMNWIEP